MIPCKTQKYRKCLITLSFDSTIERENRQQSEVISSLRSEKDSLESALYESQQSESQLNVRKEQLEGENQELILRKENLQSKPPLNILNISCCINNKLTYLYVIVTSLGLCLVLMFIFHCISGEINRLIKEKEADLEKFERIKEDLQRRLAQLEREMTLALTQEKQAHEDDVERLVKERVRQRLY